MYVDAQTIVLAGSVLSAIVAFVTLFWKLFTWINHQKEQDNEIKRIEQKFDNEMKELRNRHAKEHEETQEEQTLVIYGLLACLKGLAEQGCNGPVSEAIDKIEKHINKKAHRQN